MQRQIHLFLLGLQTTFIFIFHHFQPKPFLGWYLMLVFGPGQFGVFFTVVVRVCGVCHDHSSVFYCSALMIYMFF